MHFRKMCFLDSGIFFAIFSLTSFPPIFSNFFLWTSICIFPVLLFLFHIKHSLYFIASLWVICSFHPLCVLSSAFLPVSHFLYCLYCFTVSSSFSSAFFACGCLVCPGLWKVILHLILQRPFGPYWPRQLKKKYLLGIPALRISCTNSDPTSKYDTGYHVISHWCLFSILCSPE